MAGVEVDALRDDQWERLRDLVPGGREGPAWAALRQPPVRGCAAVDGALWRALARPARAVW